VSCLSRECPVYNSDSTEDTEGTEDTKGGKGLTKERTRHTRCALLLLVVSAVSIAGGVPPAEGALTEAARLAAIYETILGAHFDEADREIARACPPAPREACLALDSAVLWWRILVDPDSRRLDEPLERASKRAIDAAGEWTNREPTRAEAWFYLAGSHAPLVQMRALRGERLAAARDGNRVRAALERAIALDPTLHDAYFGIGLYHYYADVVPAAARFLRMLLLMPGGDREQGMREMARARQQGVLLAGEADFQMHWLYLWYEKQPERALALVQDLDARYPANPVFLQRIAEIRRDYLRDHRASADAWRTLLARAESRRVEAIAVAEARARIGLGAALLELSQPEHAIDHLKTAVATGSDAFYSSHALAQLLLGTAYDRIGRRDLAKDAYAAAINAAPRDDPLQIRKRARDRLRAHAGTSDPRR
jgi:tetratricopeptide (TPR) repeat protein